MRWGWASSLSTWHLRTALNNEKELYRDLGENITIKGAWPQRTEAGKGLQCLGTEISQVAGELVSKAEISRR